MGKNHSIAITAIVLAVAVVAFWWLRGSAPERERPTTDPYVVDARPDVLGYDDLQTLRDTPRELLDADLRNHLDTLLRTPFINNEAYYAGSSPHLPEEPGLGAMIRLVSWNIERGIRFGLLRDALAGGDGFLDEIVSEDDDLAITPEVRREIERELHVLRTADVLVLQELDWGMKRTGYRAVVEELAAAAAMNWVYGVEFVEVDPISLGIENFADADEADREELRRRIAVDEGRYRGLHGTAVLSRFPIAGARLIPLESQGYDWFTDELDGVSVLEQAKREASEEIFRTGIGREIRRGGRTLLLVDLDVPRLAEGRLTVAAAHFESRAAPAARQEQLQEVLGHLRGVGNPVVLAGDMNTSGQDGTPTSWKREIYRRLGDEEFWGRTAVKYLSGVGIAFDAIVTGIGVLRRTNDPTVEHVPVLSPNEEERFFEILEEFRFDDGFAFDFRGDVSRSVNGQEGTLANSNQRDAEGFSVTFEVERTVGPAGKLKLDWIFVKAYAADARDPGASYVFAPHRGRTMELLNYGVAGRLSDHSPISVALPLPGTSR